MINFLTLKKLTLLLIVVSFFACEKDKNQAIDSLEGDWRVLTINSYYGTFTPTGGISNLTTVEETGDLGTFSFGEERVNYSFTRNDTLYQGSTTWSLSTDEVREGFFTSTRFSLDIEGDFLFNVVFEDDTSNSEKDARDMTMMDESNAVETGVAIELKLAKE